MKALRLIGMALLALCVNFASCSSDDEPKTNEEGVVTNEKKLVEIKEAYEDGTNVMTFSYDSKGKLTSIVVKDFDSSNSDIINITWGENTIKESSNGESITYFLNDGLIRTGSDSDGRDYSFVYNSSKQLTTYQYRDKYGSDTRTYTWEDGKVTKRAVETEYENTTTEITYNSQTCKGYFPLMVLMIEDDFKAVLGHPELVGMRATQLPNQSYSKDNNLEWKEEYTYKLDKAGYVESCTQKEIDIENGETWTSTINYTFKWE